MSIHLPDGGTAPSSRIQAAWEAFVARPTPVVLAAALLAQVVALLVMHLVSPLLVAGAVVLAAVLPLALGSVARTLSLLVFVLIAIPRVAKWPFMPIAYSDAIGAAFLLLGALLAARDRLDRSDFTWHPQSLTSIWLALIVWTVFVVANGLLRSTPRPTFLYELIQLSLYGTFFLAMDGLRRPRDFRLLFAALAAGVLVVCGEYVIAAIAQGAGELRWGRVISRQANLTLAIAPFLVGLFLTGRSRPGLWLVGFIPLAIVALLSQQRSLLATLPISIGVAVLVGVRAPSVSRRRIGLLLGAMALAGAIAWGAVGTLRAPGRPSVTEGLTERTEEISSGGGAPALLIRFVSFVYVWNEKIIRRPLTGWGLGDTADIPILRNASFSMMRVDNAFVVLAWKSGLIGLSLVLLLWFAVIYRAWALARHPHPEVQIIAIGVAGCLSSVLVLSLAGAIITHYRFNAVWGILMAAVLAAERAYAPAPGEAIRSDGGPDRSS